MKQRRVALEDSPLELRELLARLEAELDGEPMTRTLEGVERVRLTARAI